MRSRLLAGATALALGLLTTGFIRIALEPEGPEFIWGEPRVRYLVQREGSHDVADGSARAAVRLAFRAWARPGVSLVLVEDDVADASRSDHTAPDIHLVTWDEDGSSGLFPDGSGVLALTPVLAQTRDGRILDADIVLNGRENTFSTNLKAGSFDIQAVVTHEVGHFLGLDHANGPCSTMFHLISAGSPVARHVGRDEEAGIASIYPADGSRGAISGLVTKIGAGPLAYGYVVALDALTGEVSGGAPTNAVGRYAIRGLLPGEYVLYVEPLDGPVRAADTIRLAQAPADVAFDTTWLPGRVRVTSGGEASGVDVHVSPVGSSGSGPNPRDVRGGVVVAGGPQATLTLIGPGLDRVTAATIPGAGVNVVSTTRTVVGKDPAVVLQLTAAADAARGGRSVELRDDLGRIGIMTCALVVFDPAPRIESVSPTTLSAGGGETLTVHGQNFHAPASVLVGGELAAVASVSHDGRTLSVPAPVGRSSAPSDVVVIGGDGQEARLPAAVTYVASSPVATRVVPDRGPLAGGSRHTIVGSGFLAPAAVTVGGRSATVTSVTPEAIEFTLPSAARPGPVDVVVEMTGALTGVERGLTYIDAPPLVVSAIFPTRGPAAGGTSVELTGSGFSAVPQVTFDGVPASVVNATPTSVVVTSPAHERGAVEVVVSDRTTGFTATAPERFSYEDVSTTPPLTTRVRRKSGCALGGDGESPLALAPFVLALAILSAAALRCRGA